VELIVVCNVYLFRFLTLTFSLGLVSETRVDLCGSVLDSLCAHLQQLLVYEEGEKDAVYLCSYTYC